MSNQSQTPRQQEKVRTLALDLMHRAMVITQTTKHDVSVHYNSHVNLVTCSFHVGGYENSPAATYIEHNDNYGIHGIYLCDPIKLVNEFFELANAELDKLVADSKAA